MEFMSYISPPIIWLLIILLMDGISDVSSLGCFVCSSINGSEPDCEDTFNNTGQFYRQICMGGRRGHRGLFPGTECIKIKANLPGTDYNVLIRDCVVDTGGINSETEIGRESHCWLINMIKLRNIDMKGCSLACRTDGCNDAVRTSSVVTTIGLALMVSVTLAVLNAYSSSI